MAPASHTVIQVLIIRDELGVGNRPSTEQTEELLKNEPRLRVAAAASGYGEALRAARRQRPDVILIDGVLGGAAGLVAELDEALPRIPLLVALHEVERDHAHECVVAGARGCLVRPFQRETLIHTIIQVHERAVRRRKLLQEDQHTGGRAAGKIIAVRGAKGGVGCTVIATNLAVAIKRRSDQRVALVDAHLFGGDVPLALDMTPDRSLGDLLPHMHSLDDELLDSTLIKHVSGIDVLAAPPDLERAEAITPEDFQRVMEALRARYDYVVVDSPSVLDHNSLIVLDMADLLLLVCTPEIAALKNAARFVRLGLQFGYSDAKMRLVINRRNSPGAVARPDIESYLHYKTSFHIPNDGTSAVKALNRGQPLVTFDRSCGPARALQRLARVVVENEGWDAEPGRAHRRPIRLPSLRRLPARLRLGEPVQEQAR
jgi:pilus assembly protein CpaE